MKVSLVLTVYNATWCVEHALDSVLRQSRVPEEILVCDDGSTDGTADLVEQRYGAAVSVLRLPHRNASATRREGLARAGGDWLAFMDADDTWFPDKLERQLDFIARHPDVRMVMSDGVYASAEGVLRESWLSDYFDPVREMVGDLFPPLIERCFPLMSSVMVERSAYREVGGLDPDITYSHDYDLWLRVLARHRGGLMADRLITYYSSPGALSRRYEERYRDDLAIMRRIQRGELGKRPKLQRRAARRAAALEFDLALLCLRTGRNEEAREHLWRAMARGPLRRRLISAAGALAPDWWLTRLLRSRWIKQTAAASRQAPGILGVGDEAREAA